MEIIGFLFLCFINGWFSLACTMNFAMGGGDLGPLLSGWVNWKIKVLGVAAIMLNIYFWYLLLKASPFSITVN